ncbi:MAG: twin-arginine translocase TatA/TatE family subunit [Planctomycetaceae bacterium]|nr:twin-arginine translocase TatA/TatE family subunit [Planctomycetaceae bacterium]
MSPLLAGIGPFGPVELVVIGLVAVLLFGNRLPKAMRGLGQSFVSFKQGLNETEPDAVSQAKP